MMARFESLFLQIAQIQLENVCTAGVLVGTGHMDKMALSAVSSPRCTYVHGVGVVKTYQKNSITVPSTRGI
jgi:hypothetical protein